MLSIAFGACRQSGLSRTGPAWRFESLHLKVRQNIVTNSLKVVRRTRNIGCGETIEVFDPLISRAMLFSLSCSVSFVFVPSFHHVVFSVAFPGTSRCISCFPKEGVPCRSPRDLFSSTLQYGLASSANPSLIWVTVCSSGRSQLPHRHYSILSGICFQQKLGFGLWMWFASIQSIPHSPSCIAALESLLKKCLFLFKSSRIDCIYEPICNCCKFSLTVLHLDLVVEDRFLRYAVDA